MTKQSLLEQYLSLYNNRTNIAMDLFYQKFGVRNPTSKWRDGLIARTGFLDKNNKIQYSLHGAGCTVWMEDEETIFIDFLEGEDYSFDSWKFSFL